VDDTAIPITPVLDIYNRRGLAKTLVDAYAAMAGVCLQRHHRSPRAWSVQIDADPAQEYEVSWRQPTDQERLSYADDEEATEFGACSLALAAAEAHLGLVAYARAKPRSGVDFYLLADDADITEGLSYDFDHERSIGLEVSGIDRDSDAAVSGRLREKVEQVRRGWSPDRALAVVVGFRGARIVFRTAKP
jgi:hypothetical protein